MAEFTVASRVSQVCCMRVRPHPQLDALRLNEELQRVLQDDIHSVLASFVMLLFATNP